MKPISLGLLMLALASLATSATEWRGGARSRDVLLMAIIASLVGVSAAVAYVMD